MGWDVHIGDISELMIGNADKLTRILSIYEGKNPMEVKFIEK